MINIILTNHAIARFVARSKKMGIPVPKSPQLAIRRLLEQAVLCDIDPVHKVKRIIKGGEEAKYYEAQGWRFVVTGDGLKLITVERIKPEQN